MIAFQNDEAEDHPQDSEGSTGGGVPTTAAGTKEVTAPAKEELARTDDPVTIYFREMGSIELLSRQGEIEIAKRIEAGREKMIGGICESPLTLDAIVQWREELKEGTTLLREVVDLDATYGRVPGQSAPGNGADANAPGANGASGQSAGNGAVATKQSNGAAAAPAADGAMGQAANGQAQTRTGRRGRPLAFDS